MWLWEVVRFCFLLPRNWVLANECWGGQWCRSKILAKSSLHCQRTSPCGRRVERHCVGVYSNICMVARYNSCMCVVLRGLGKLGGSTRLRGAVFTALQCSLATRKLSVCPPKTPKGLKTQNGRFSSTIAIRLKKVCYKVSLCENCQWQSCRAFIGLTIHVEVIGGDVPFYAKIWPKLTQSLAKRRFSIHFRS